MNSVSTRIPSYRAHLKKLIPVKKICKVLRFDLEKVLKALSEHVSEKPLKQRTQGAIAGGAHSKKPPDGKRNEKALTLHLIPYFGSKRLVDVRMEDGLVYLEKRRAEKVAEGTIERECAVLSAVLNLAVECEVLDKNRLRRLPVPQYVKRERVAESWKLQKIQKASSQEVWRVIILAL